MENKLNPPPDNFIPTKDTELRQEINTRLWLAFGDVTGKDPRMVRAVNAIEEMLEAHGKAEYEPGKSEKPVKLSLSAFCPNPLCERQDCNYANHESVISVVEKAHAAGFTEGVEKAIAAVKKESDKECDENRGNLPYYRYVHRFGCELVEVLEALKPKTIKP